MPVASGSVLTKPQNKNDKEKEKSFTRWIRTSTSPGVYVYDWR